MLFPTFSLSLSLLSLLTIIHARPPPEPRPRGNTRHLNPSRRALTTAWNYVGCREDSTPRALAGYSYTDSKMTVESCVSTCNSKGYSLAGTEAGTECYCANAVTSGKGNAKAESECKVACGGDSTEKCGASWRLSVYSKPTYQSLGCYTDSSTRTLSPAFVSWNNMTTNVCVSYCGSQGYSYGGTEYGAQCFCGNSILSTARSSTGCNHACNGDSSQTCGGSYAINIYSIPACGQGLTSGCNVKATATGVQPGASSFISSTSTSKSTSITTTKASTSTSTKASTTSTKASSTILSASSTSKASSTSASSTTSTSTTGPTSVVGVAKPVSATGTKYLWAHHIVGNTYSYTQSTWADDISMAASAGIDGFALNMGSDSWQPARIADAYAAAQAHGSFKLFFSFDVTSFSCSSANDATNLANLVTTYKSSSAQATHNGKILVSTFAGDGCSFGQGSVTAGWNYVRSLLTNSNTTIELIPAIFSDPAQFKTLTWLDGEFNWNSGWPMGSANLDTSSDTLYINDLGNKTYMPAVSPCFFTYYGPNSYNKDWIYRSDDWLLATRMEQLIGLRNKFDMVELISWNDYGESHYVGPIRADQPMSQGWTNNMPHTAWLPIIKLYSQAFKTGSYPSSSDSLYLWSRPHPKAATPTSPSNPRPSGADNTDDNLYVLVTLSSAATVNINSGANKASFSLPSGISKLSIGSAAGTIGANIVRGSTTVKSYDSSGTFTYVAKPTDYNFNYFVGSA
ncbi:hypothetical protein TREMEDRAFT_44661 [Tremella mesenterica DSM 1558]|uniref:uncharacterized protein n=1 Tax=Tremella mesenterica (strain ATCC 24925 / CBS 8224 / DSM 1558 / NBRC 9311 / NRRL Y-6157 / RJB 2259-6 / UBC 559-6) TaxID=578456 RepID=UPI0003F49549|nr:uncharacterized protein TREMEDRAFT_44661 [Tremella mesenterica DSM 1558]EIW68225.1 hypothetical protein TREMEDRAFT_44661 [Tremella mesenterica DSM 1558]